MALSTSTSRKRGIMAEINVTPLTDVFLVLLIIFMITTFSLVFPSASFSTLASAPSSPATGRSFT